MSKDTYTRTEIFDLLWMEAASKVAKRLGISDVGLAKWCRQHDVPKPRSGYWSKKLHGVEVPDKPKLPKWVGRLPEPSNEVRIRDDRQSSQSIKPIPNLPLFRGNTYHPIVLKTFENAGDDHLSKYGRWYADEGFSVEVGPASQVKAKLILQTLTDALLAEGFELKNYQAHYREKERPSFCRDEERIVISIYEPSKKLSKPIQKKQSWSHGGTTHSYFRDIEYQAGGIVEIKLDHPDTYPTRIIRENQKRSLEDALGIVMSTIHELCVEAIETRKQRELSRIEAAKEQKRLDDIKWAKEVEAWKWAQLKGAAERWKELAVLREFVQAMQTSKGVARKNKGLTDWVSWAQKQINTRDPILKVASGKSLPGQNEPIRNANYEDY